MDSKKFVALYKDKFATAITPEASAALELFVAKLDSVKSPQQKAYVLATVKHEVGDTWLPIVERCGVAYAARYETGLLGATLGNVNSGDGYRYRGRGYCQLTGRNNYKKFGKLLDIKLEENPDLALQPDVALQILILGMTNGLFTGRKLSNYITDASVDYVNARRIINGDVSKNGAKIAEYAVKIEKILKQC